MSTSLFNGLIRQIMHSEEKVRERCNKLRACMSSLQCLEVQFLYIFFSVEKISFSHRCIKKRD